MRPPQYMFSSSRVIANVNHIRKAHLFAFVKHICSAKFIRRSSSAATHKFAVLTTWDETGWHVVFFVLEFDGSLRIPKSCQSCKTVQHVPKRRSAQKPVQQCASIYAHVYIYNKISMPCLSRWRTGIPRGPHSRCRFTDVRLFQVRSYCSFTTISPFLLQFCGYTIILAAVW